ncbi:hypothetical protein QNO08_09175 [Arthrobacter sp. zg-Y820]|uniref:hypothetical protein n=1 Tax=unclassified Arthrobacter TaxID=235627 RepID=UPI001E2D9624|nr:MULTISPECIES: hypothetical protein [unclassified Arthrobacter]MCC9196712.1 hypothetical protein [Arthrobacter sp. zg-Y820]MDK1279574.1 hypothetical protein [Arthrobacter sp. zg.Y820]WIB08053.1 hypothetical protein QNO08_09175 [Arthrobacter sp. zg-Y820]
MLALAAVFSQTAINLARPLISYKVLALRGDAAAVGAVSASFALLPGMAGLAAAPLGPSGAVWTSCLVMSLSAAVKAPSARRGKDA